MSNMNFCPPAPMENYGFGGFASLQPYISNQLWIDSNNWLNPHNIVFNMYGSSGKDREKHFEELIITKCHNGYYANDRNGRRVHIGELKIINSFLVNLKPDGTFDAFLGEIECSGVKEPIRISIPYEDFVKRRILQYIPFFPRNVDCPDNYIIKAFFKELENRDDTKILTLAETSGWSACSEKQAVFASSELVIPQIKGFYASDILERKLLQTELRLQEAADNLARILPEGWQYKLLLTIRIASILLYFYEREGLITDRLLIIEPQSEKNAKDAIALLKNKDYDGTSVYSITECRTALQGELNLINDGMAVFRDSSLVEDAKRRSVGMQTLLQDLTGLTGNTKPKRHMCAVISDNPGELSSEIPAIFVTLRGCETVDDLSELQQGLGIFDRSLINLLSNSDLQDNLVTIEMKQTGHVTTTNLTGQDGRLILNEGKTLSATAEILCHTATILKKYNLMTFDEWLEISSCLGESYRSSLDSEQLVCNEFRTVLSDCILRGEIEVTPQFGTPYFDPVRYMIIIDAKYLNFQARVLESRILSGMHTTHNRGKLLHALDDCGKLYHNNNFKRNIEVRTSSGDTETVSVYSVPQTLLTPPAHAKIRSLAYADYLFNPGSFPQSFLPIMALGENQVAGRIIDDTTDEAESIYASGRTRSGKTFFLIQQAVLRAQSGERVIIFDQTGGFDYEKLISSSMLPQEVIDESVSFWNLHEKGMPVDLLSLENCSTRPDKKNRLFSVLSIAGRITGEVQGKLLKKQLPPIVEAIDKGDISDISDILQYFDESDPALAEIRSRMEDVFDDLEDVPVYHQNWGTFLESQKKVVIISTASDGVRKHSQLIDMLLANLYAYKQNHSNPRYTVVLDEIEDLCLEKDGPISCVLRKGAKHRLSMLLASQEFSTEKKTKLAKLIGNCGMLVFFRPKDADISEIASHTGIERETLAHLEQGECVAVGGFYSRAKARNCHAKLKGRTFCETARFHDTTSNTTCQA